MKNFASKTFTKDGDSPAIHTNLVLVQ